MTGRWVWVLWVFGLASLAACSKDGECCPVRLPVDGCWSPGGVISQGGPSGPACTSVCGCPPARFREVTDLFGCPRLEPDGPAVCEAPAPDASLPDAPAPDVAPRDARPQVTCCPAFQHEPTCWSPGGPERGGTCSRFCDCPPSAFRRGRDEYGCEILIPDGPPQCFLRDGGAGMSVDVGPD